MKKLLLLLLLTVNLCSFTVKAQDTIVMQNVTFETDSQSLWGPTWGGINIDYPFFDWGWNTSGNYGGISELAGFHFGATLAASTWGSFGAGLTIKIGNEMVTVDYEADVALRMPAAKTFNRGEEVAIKTSYTPDPSGCSIGYGKYDFLFKLWLKMGLGVHLNGQACVFSCTNYSLLNVELPTDTFDLVSITPTDIELLEGLYEIPSNDYFNNMTITYSDDKGIIDLTIQLPQNGDSTIFMSGNNVVAASAPFEYASITFDIPKFIGALNIPYVSAFFGNLSNSWNLGPLNVWYTLLKAGFALRLYHRQVLTFRPTMYTQLKFPTVVDYKVVTPGNSLVASGSDSVVTCLVGNNVKFNYPCNYEFMDISAKYSITNTFTNHTYDSLAFNFYLQILGFGITMPNTEIIPEICIPIYEPCGPWYCYICDWCYCCDVCTPAVVFPGFSWGWGPLVDKEYNIFNISYDWVNRTWPLTGFNTVTKPPFRLRPKPYSVNAVSTAVACYGQSTGTATATLLNGKPPYRYEWSNGVVHTSSSSTDQVTNLGAGTHYVIVTDVNNCATFTDVIVGQPATALAVDAIVHPVDCYSNLTGSINLSPSGGTAGYSYSWNSGQISQDINGVAAGNYTVTVSDLNGCTSVQSYSVAQPPQLLATTVFSNVNCHGDSTATASVSAVGGILPYTYNWSNGASAPAVTALAAGSYVVTVTDFNGCQNTQSITVSQPAQAVDLAVATGNVMCYGDASGYVHIAPNGGTAPYSTQWYNPAGQILNQSSSNMDSIFTGTYTAVVTDALGCVVDTTVSILQPPQIQHGFSTVDNLCFGESNGSISLLVSGGTLPFTYTWSNGDSDTSLSSLPAGNYAVTITDANGCNVLSSVSIYQPATAVAASVIPLNVLCFGNSTGQANLAPVGGTPPYTYLWSNGFTGEDLNSVAAGAYTVTVTDNNGCNAYSGTVIKQPLDSLSVLTTVSNASCNGLSDGSILIHASGGTTPYYIRWDDTDYLISSTGHLLSNLPAGTYQFIVTDANGCQVVRNITITAPVAMQLDASSTIVHCFAGNDGSLDLSVIGGTLPYTYHWSNGSSAEDIAGLTAGSYSVTVSDANGCAVSQSFQVGTMPEIQVIGKVSPISCIDNADGTISITATGGAGNIGYLWSTGSTLSSIKDLASGNYSLTVTDANGCSRVMEFFVPESELECISIPNTFTPNDDGVNDEWIIRNIDLYPENSVKIFNRWGNLMYEASPYTPAWDGTFKGDPVPAETYYYIINLNNGTAVFTGTVTIVR